MEDRVRRPWEAAPEELGHRLVEVEQQRHPGKPQRNGGEGQEVGQAVDLDEPVATAAVGPGEGPAGAKEEREVLAEIDPEPRALMALDAEPPDMNTGDVSLDRVVSPAQGEDVDGMPGSDERFGLAADPRILVVIRVDDHRDRPVEGFAGLSGTASGSIPHRGQPAFQPAPRRRTRPAGAARPAELLTVSTTRSASR